jgi:hypothetical protein
MPYQSYLYESEPLIEIKSPSCCPYNNEKLFIQPDKGITTVNSDNMMGVQLVDFDTEKIYENQKLTGQANPRTKIAPIMPARPYDGTYWKDTPINKIGSKVSIINSRKIQYPSLAGYNTDELVDNIYVYPNRKNLSDYDASPLVQSIQPGVYTIPSEYVEINNGTGVDGPSIFEPIQRIHLNGNIISQVDDKYIPPLDEETNDPSFPPPEQSSKETKENYKSGQQRENRPERPKPTSKPKPKYPILKEPEYPILPRNDVSIYNVFDPRFSGYGSDDRHYIEPTTGQPRYYYDDVDAIRRPNYIVRSKLDNCVTGFGDQYGPMRDNQLSLNEMRGMAESSYLNNNMNFRNDLMESLMRRRNTEMWQLRQAPMYTNRQSLK